MGWNLLSYKKKVAASSSLEGYEPELANDEQVETRGLHRLVTKVNGYKLILASLWM